VPPDDADDIRQGLADNGSAAVDLRGSPKL